MLRTLTERAEAKVALQERERYLRRQNEVVADPDSPFEQKVRRLLELGQERLGMDCAALTRWDGDELETVTTVGGHEKFDEDDPSPVEDTYCRKVLARDAPLIVEHAAEQGGATTPPTRSGDTRATSGPRSRSEANCTGRSVSPPGRRERNRSRTRNRPSWS